LQLFSRRAVFAPTSPIIKLFSINCKKQREKNKTLVLADGPPRRRYAAFRFAQINGADFKKSKRETAPDAKTRRTPPKSSDFSRRNRFISSDLPTLSRQTAQ